MSDKKQILYANDNATLTEINKTWNRLKRDNRKLYSETPSTQQRKSACSSRQ